MLTFGITEKYKINTMNVSIGKQKITIRTIQIEFYVKTKNRLFGIGEKIGITIDGVDENWTIIFFDTNFDHFFFSKH